MSVDIYTGKASLSDLEKIMKIENACFGADAFSRQQMAYLISHAKGIFLVAKYDDKIAGYISFITSKRHNTGRIYSVAVMPEYRNYGVGGKLLNKTIEYAIQKELNAIFLEVRTDNLTAISIYEKKGFTKRFIKPNYYHDGADGYSMVLEFVKD